MKSTSVATLTIACGICFLAAGSGARAAPFDCGSVAGLEALLEPGTVAVFGEMHGTAEAPAFVADVVCGALAAGRSVTIGLEMPRSLSAAVEAYLASDGEAGDREALLTDDFWQRPYQDGRASAAMLALIERLRRLRRQGRVEAVLLDISQPAASGQARDRAMASRLGAAITASATELFVILTGNVHARLAVGTRWDPAYEPMAFLAAGELPQRRWIALDLGHGGGSAWICTGAEVDSCQPRRLSPRYEAVARGIVLGDAAGEAFSGTWWVDELTASPPAVDSDSNGEQDAEPMSSFDWPRWMGPRGDGVSTQTGVFAAEEVELVESWRRPIGRGYSSISVVGEGAYTLAASGGGTALVAVAVADGRQLWRAPMGYGGDGSEPKSTPTVDGGRVFAIDARGGLYAFDAGDGRRSWSRDLAEFGADPPSYGFSTSPWVEDDLVLVLAGGREDHNLVAFDQASGEVVWSVFPAELGSYSSPVVATLGGRRQIVVPAGDKLYGVDAGGEVLWVHEGLSYPDRNPLVLDGDRLLMPLEEAGVMLQVRHDGRRFEVEESWRTTRLKDSYSPAVHLDGAIYGFDSNFLVCLDAASGATHWRHRLSGGVLILVDRHLLVLGQTTGRLHLVAADPEGFSERFAVEVFEPGKSTVTPPSFGSGRIFLRNHEEMVALVVAPREAGPAAE